MTSKNSHLHTMSREDLTFFHDHLDPSAESTTSECKSYHNHSETCLESASYNNNHNNNNNNNNRNNQYTKNNHLADHCHAAQWRCQGQCVTCGSHMIQPISLTIPDFTQTDSRGYRSETGLPVHRSPIPGSRNRVERSPASSFPPRSPPCATQSGAGMASPGLGASLGPGGRASYQPMSESARWEMERRRGLTEKAEDEDLRPLKLQDPSKFKFRLKRQLSSGIDRQSNDPVQTVATPSRKTAQAIGQHFLGPAGSGSGISSGTKRDSTQLERGPEVFYPENEVSSLKKFKSPYGPLPSPVKRSPAAGDTGKFCSFTRHHLSFSEPQLNHPMPDEIREKSEIYYYEREDDHRNATLPRSYRKRSCKPIASPYGYDSAEFEKQQKTRYENGEGRKRDATLMTRSPKVAKTQSKLEDQRRSPEIFKFPNTGPDLASNNNDEVDGMDSPTPMDTDDQQSYYSESRGQGESYGQRPGSYGSNYLNSSQFGGSFQNYMSRPTLPSNGTLFADHQVHDALFRQTHQYSNRLPDNFQPVSRGRDAHNSRSNQRFSHNQDMDDHDYGGGRGSRTYEQPFTRNVIVGDCEVLDQSEPDDVIHFPFPSDGRGSEDPMYDHRMGGRDSSFAHHSDLNNNTVRTVADTSVSCVISLSELSRYPEQSVDRMKHEELCRAYYSDDVHVYNVYEASDDVDGSKNNKEKLKSQACENTRPGPVVVNKDKKCDPAWLKIGTDISSNKLTSESARYSEDHANRSQVQSLQKRTFVTPKQSYCVTDCRISSSQTGSVCQVPMQHAKFQNQEYCKSQRERERDPAISTFCRDVAMIRNMHPENTYKSKNLCPKEYESYLPANKSHIHHSINQNIYYDNVDEEEDAHLADEVDGRIDDEKDEKKKEKDGRSKSKSRRGESSKAAEDSDDDNDIVHIPFDEPDGDSPKTNTVRTGQTEAQHALEFHKAASELEGQSKCHPSEPDRFEHGALEKGHMHEKVQLTLLRQDDHAQEISRQQLQKEQQLRQQHQQQYREEVQHTETGRQDNYQQQHRQAGQQGNLQTRRHMEDSDAFRFRSAGEEKLQMPQRPRTQRCSSESGRVSPLPEEIPRVRSSPSKLGQNADTEDHIRKEKLPVFHRPWLSPPRSTHTDSSCSTAFAAAVLSTKESIRKAMPPASLRYKRRSEGEVWIPGTSYPGFPTKPCRPINYKSLGSPANRKLEFDNNDPVDQSCLHVDISPVTTSLLPSTSKDFQGRFSEDFQSRCSSAFGPPPSKIPFTSRRPEAGQFVTRDQNGATQKLTTTEDPKEVEAAGATARRQDEVDIHVRVTDILSETRRLGRKLEEIYESTERSSCECARIEKEILRVALDLFRNHGNQTDLDNNEWHEELRKTNMQIRDAIDLAKNCRRLCRHGRSITDVYTGSVIIRIRCPTLTSLFDLLDLQSCGELQVLLYSILNIGANMRELGMTLSVELDRKSVLCCKKYLLNQLQTPSKSKKSPSKKSPKKTSPAKRVVRSEENLLQSPPVSPVGKSKREMSSSTPVLSYYSPLVSPMSTLSPGLSTTPHYPRRERKFSFGEGTRCAFQELNISDTESPRSPCSVNSGKHDVNFPRRLSSPNLLTSSHFRTSPNPSPVSSPRRLKQCDVIQEQENIHYDDGHG